MDGRYAALNVLRVGTASGALLGTMWLWIAPGLVPDDALPWLWLGAACTIGFALPRWPTLLLAPLPWPVVLWYKLATGRLPFLGEGWWIGVTVLTLVGVVGIALGMGVGCLLELALRAWRPRESA